MFSINLRGAGSQCGPWAMEYFRAPFLSMIGTPPSFAATPESAQWESSNEPSQYKRYRRNTVSIRTRSMLRELCSLECLWFSRSAINAVRTGGEPQGLTALQLLSHRAICRPTSPSGRGLTCCRNILETTLYNADLRPSTDTPLHWNIDVTNLGSTCVFHTENYSLQRMTRTKEGIARDGQDKLSFIINDSEQTCTSSRAHRPSR